MRKHLESSNIDVAYAQILRRHGDVFERTSRGYYHAHGRADDTMNLGGIKVCILRQQFDLRTGM